MFATRPILDLAARFPTVFLEPLSQNALELIIHILRKFRPANFNHIDLIISQFCTCHDSSAVVTCAKLWDDWIISLQVKANIFLEDFEYKLINHLWNSTMRWERSMYLAPFAGWLAEIIHTINGISSKLSTRKDGVIDPEIGFPSEDHSHPEACLMWLFVRAMGD